MNQPLQVIVIAGQSNAQGWMGDGTQYPKDPADEKIPFRWMIPGSNSFFHGASQYGKGWENLSPQNGFCGHGNPALHFGLEVAMARTLAKADPNMEWTSMVGLQKADISHLNNDGLIKHGEQIAEVMYRLWKKKSVRPGL